MPTRSVSVGSARHRCQRLCGYDVTRATVDLQAMQQAVGTPSLDNGDAAANIDLLKVAPSLAVQAIADDMARRALIGKAVHVPVYARRWWCQTLVVVVVVDFGVALFDLFFLDIAP